MLENLQPMHPHASSGSDALLQRHRLAEQFPNHLSTRHCRTWSETVESEELRKETMDGHHGGIMLLVSKQWMEYFGMTWPLLRPALVASCAMQRIWAQSAMLSCLQRQTSVNYHELSSFGIWGRGKLWTRPRRVRNDCRTREWMILWASSLAPSAKLRIWELTAWTGSRNRSAPTLSSILQMANSSNAMLQKSAPRCRKILHFSTPTTKWLPTYGKSVVSLDWEEKIILNMYN